MSHAQALQSTSTPSKKRSIPPTGRNTTPSSKADGDGVDSEITTISHFGNLVLEVSKEGATELILAKVDSDKLVKTSKYFKTLLDPTGFLEGSSILKQQERLKEVYSNPHDIPDEDLPRVKITDIGQTSALNSIRLLVIDFLRILHGYDIQRAVKNPPSVNIANLAVLADRFDAKDSISSWALSKANVLPKIHASLPVYDEEIYRQRLLTCMFLGNESRMMTYSSHLILQGSVMWQDDPPKSNTAMWWDLPNGIEEELQARRSHVLETILSLQDYLLGLYTSKNRQCRLGYDSSPQCDSFQLGEFVKYLTRIGTLRLHGTYTESEEPPIASGDIRTMMRDLRACPSYQLDPNHAHCGPKKQLLAGLDFIQARIAETHIGICYRCWRTPTKVHSWSKLKRLPFFNTKNETYVSSNDPGACDRARVHDSAADFFMAVDRGWQPLLYGRS